MSPDKLPLEKCPFKDCVNYIDCGIIEITKKVPKKDGKCSYYGNSKSKTGKRKWRTHIETEGIEGGLL